MKKNKTIFLEKYRKPHPLPLPRREGSDVHCELMWNGNRLSNHTTPLPAGEGLGVGLLWVFA